MVIATLATSPRTSSAELTAGEACDPDADHVAHAAGGRAPTGAGVPPLSRGPIGHSESDVGHLGTDGLQPAALVVGIVFAAFLVRSWLTFPPGPRGLSCLHDLGMVALGFGLYAVARRRSLSLRGVHLCSAALSIGVLSNILFTAMLGVNPMFSHFVAILIVASVGSMLVPSWAIGIALIEVVGWAVVAHRLLRADELELQSLVIFSTLAVAAIVHVGRYRARARIFELRAGDARRELALQEALAEADEARRGLDRKVLERTAALRTELEERERLEEQLRHAQKLEAVGRLAGGIAHDFNNLLTVIRMSLITVGEGSTFPGEVRDAVRDASDATDRAAALTHDLLAFARKQTLERATVAVTDILGGVERMIRRVAEASIRLEVHAPAEIGDVVADRHQIEQVLLNLAINACDAMGNRGTLAISADTIELSGCDATRHRVRAGLYVRIAVSDTGTGMDETTRRSIFEPFFTTKEVGRGTGLGLAVAHGIVTQHGGQIDVESEPGKGSTFTVFLPRARVGSPRSITPAAPPVAALASETLLVVEDEAAVRRAVQRNLARLGYQVFTANDGEDALRIAGSLAGIDLLLTDVVMPGIDGPELACRLRETRADLAVLFVTGYSADRLARSGAVRPHDRVLEKPYQLAELTRTIRQMLEARTARGAGPAA